LPYFATEVGTAIQSRPRLVVNDSVGADRDGHGEPHRAGKTAAQRRVEDVHLGNARDGEIGGGEQKSDGGRIDQSGGPVPGRPANPSGTVEAVAAHLDSMRRGAHSEGSGREALNRRRGVGNNAEIERLRRSAARRWIVDRDSGGTRCGCVGGQQVGSELGGAAEGGGPVGAVPSHD